MTNPTDTNQATDDTQKASTRTLSEQHAQHGTATSPTISYTNQASEEIKIGQEVWRVISKYPTATMWTDRGYLNLDLTVGRVLVKKVVVGAIQRIETTDESAKYFFNAKTKYHYSDEPGGVCTEQSYFTISGDSLVGADNSRFYLTEEDASLSTIAATESQNEYIKDKLSDLKANIHDILAKLEAEL